MIDVHDLKCWMDWYDSITSREKTFEVRRHDRDFKEGDYLLLRELDPEVGDEGMYTGRAALCRVGYLFGDGEEPGVPGFHLEGFCIMAIQLMEEACSDYDEDWLAATKDRYPVAGENEA